MGILETIGENTKKIRKSKKISQDKLKELSGLDRTYISHIERGKVNSSVLNLEKLAKGLGVDIKDLF